MGTGVIVYAAWFLLAICAAPSPEQVPVLQRRLALCMVPLTLGLVEVTSARWGLPYTLTTLAQGLALGGAVGLAAGFWLVPYRHRLPGWLRGLASSSWIIVAVMAVWAVTYAVSTVMAWWEFEQVVGDQTCYEQALYNTLHGRFLHYSGDFRYTALSLCRFADHFEPIILLFVPLYAIWQTPVWLLAAQVLALVSGAVPVARLAREWYGLPAAALPFVLAYLLHPGLHQALAFEFHPEVFAAPFILWGIYFGLHRRLVTSSVMLLLAISCKENIPGVICLVGLFLAYKGERRFGLAVAGLALLWGILAFKVIIPGYSPVGSSAYLGILNDPRRTCLFEGGRMAWIYLGVRLGYVLEAVGPVAGVCFLAPAVFAISLSEIGLHLLSRSQYMSRFVLHYHVTLATGVVLGGIAGLAWLSEALRRRWATDADAARTIHRSVLIGFAVASLWSLLHSQNILSQFPLQAFHLPSESTQRVHRLLAQVPDEVPVLINTGAVASHLGRRAYFIHRLKPGCLDEAVLQGYEQADYIAVQAMITPEYARGVTRRLNLTLLGREGDYWLWRVNRATPGPRHERDTTDASP
jgi:uncharacterized membrane protein